MDAYQTGLIATFATALLVSIISILSISSHISMWGDIPPGRGRTLIVLSMLVGFVCILAIVGLTVVSAGVPPWASLAVLCFTVFYLAMNVVYVFGLLLTYSNLATASCVPTVLNWGAASVVGLLVVSLALVQNDAVKKSSSVTMVALSLALTLHAVYTDAVLYGHTFHAPRVAVRLEQTPA